MPRATSASQALYHPLYQCTRYIDYLHLMMSTHFSIYLLVELAGYVWTEKEQVMMLMTTTSE